MVAELLLSSDDGSQKEYGQPCNQARNRRYLGIVQAFLGSALVVTSSQSAVGSRRIVNSIFPSGSWRHFSTIVM